MTNMKKFVAYMAAVFGLTTTAWAANVAQIGEQGYETLQAAFAAAKSGDTVKLCADVDFEGAVWTPVTFNGTFDGQGHTISNFKVNDSADGFGAAFFYRLYGTVKDLTIDGATVGSATKSGNITGILAGYSYGDVLIENVTVKNSKIHGYGKVGGLIGMAEVPGSTTTLTNCKVKDTVVAGTYNVGGLVGLVQGKIEIPGTVTENAILAGDASSYYQLDTTVASVTYGGVTFENEPVKGCYWYSSGWYFAGIASLYNRYVDEAKTTESRAKTIDAFVCDVPVENPVAKIGYYGYASLEAAVIAANNIATANPTIKLMQDVTIPETLEINNVNRRTITINGQGHNITAAKTLCLVKTPLQFKGCDGVGEASSGLVSWPVDLPLFVEDGGAVSVTGGIYTKAVPQYGVNAHSYYFPQNTDGHYVFTAIDNATGLAMGYLVHTSSTGGSYYESIAELALGKTSTVSAYLLTDVDEDVSLTQSLSIYGPLPAKTYTGSVALPTGKTLSLYCNATIDNIIPSGTGTNPALKVGYTSSTYGRSAVTIKDGEVGTVTVQAYGDLTIEGGVYTGTITVKPTGTLIIKGGTFSTDPTSYLAEGYEAVAQGTTPETWVVGKAPVAQIGTTKYTSINKAIEAVNSLSGTDVTIKILCNITEALTDDYTFNKNVTIDSDVEGGVTVDFVSVDPLWSIDSDGNVLTVTENVKFKNLGQFFASYPGTGNIYNQMERLHQLWSYYGTLNIYPSARITMTGMIKMRGFGTINVTGNGNDPANKQLSGGYVSADYNGVRRMNLKDTYMTTAWIKNDGEPGGMFELTLDNATLETAHESPRGVDFGEPGGTISMKNASLIIADKIQNVTTITIDGASYGAEAVKVIDYTGSGTMTLADYATTVTVTGDEMKAEVRDNDLWIVPKTYVAQIGEGETAQKYETLAEAVAAAKSGDTVTLLVDAEETQRIVVGKNITVTIDLNGKELTSSADVAVLLDEGSNLTISNGDLIAINNGIAADGINATATIATDAYVKVDRKYVKGENYWVMNSSGKANTTFNVYGKAYCNGFPTIQLQSSNSTVNLDGAYVESWDYYAVYVNGSYSGNTVNIKDSEIWGWEAGVYVSNQYGKPIQTLNISGDTTISGQTAVEVKHTNVTIGEGVKLIQIYDYEPEFEDWDNGPCTYGWSFATTRNGDSDKPTGTITVTGGEFTGPFGIPSEIENTDKVSVSVTGGIYDTNPSAYVAEGYEAVAQGTEPETWVVAQKTIEIVVPADPEEGSEKPAEQEMAIVIPQQVLVEDMNVDQAVINKLVSGTDDEKREAAQTIQTVINTSQANNLTVWQNYVMGVNGTQATNALKPVEGQVTTTEVEELKEEVQEEAKKEKVEPVVIETPIQTFNKPAGTGVTVKYNLIKGTMVNGEIVWNPVPVKTLDTPRYVIDMQDEKGDTFWKIEAVFTGATR